MPVRKIKKNHLVITGRVALGTGKQAAGFEGDLELDYLQLLRYDPMVSKFEVQPVKVPVPGARPYVPDVLVHFKTLADGTIRPPELTEVKPKNRFLKDQAKFAPRFAAAELFASERGWVFVKKDETDIRTPRLQAVKFLHAYVRQEHPLDAMRDVMAGIDQLGGRTDVEALLAHLCRSVDDRLAIAPVVWHLVATRQIAIDYDEPMTGDIEIWVATK